jgi:catechol 2,3-dioxygenase-like lactoylglutathione lyase family enzyme
MKFKIDHVVIAVSDLERAKEDYGSLGFNVQVGGKHAGRTSHNALIVFADGTYIELIAWTGPAQERWYDLHAKHGEGLIDFALLPEDTPGAVAEAASRGLAMAAPQDGGRVRPDGQELRWQIARQPSFDLPFLCGDVTPRDLRVPPDDMRKHVNGAKGIASLSVLVKDLEASKARYAALLGPAVAIEPTGLRLGSTRLRLVAPGNDPERRQRLADRGEGPYALEIAAGVPRRRLDMKRTHGVPIEIGN